MPLLNTVASMSSHSFGGIYVGHDSYPPFSNQSLTTVSPAVDGQTTILLNRTTLSSCGTWTIIPSADFYANVKMWGAGGGASSNHPSGSQGIGGQGGFSKGNVQFLAGVTYQFIVGCGGGGYVGVRAGGGGGGGTGIQISSGSVPILVAGAGGGSGYSGTDFAYGGDGGGATGQTGWGAYGGGGGTQSAAGAGGVGPTGTGGNGGGRNAGPGAPISLSGPGGTGGTGFGIGGHGGYVSTDAGGGGGGGGYFGAGGGGYASGSSGGGGGSSYYNPTYVNTATLIQGYGVDTARGTAGAWGFNGTAGQAGKIVITTDPV